MSQNEIAAKKSMNHACMKYHEIMIKVFRSYKNEARAPKVSPQSVQRSKSGGEACSNDSKSRSFVRQSVFNRKRMNSKERTTYDRKVRIGAQLPNGEVFPM